MKWIKRLKSVLTETEKSEFSDDCLETELRITGKSRKSEVFAVIRSDEVRHLSKNLSLSDKLEKQQNLVSAVIRSGYTRESLKNNEKLADFKTESLHKVLNQFIEAGCTIIVSTHNFQVIDNNQNLKVSDRDFIELNRSIILCHFQQSLLMKHLFSHSPEQFEDFAFEIRERESLLTITAETPFEIYFEAVKQITRKWFEDLLNKSYCL
jgi:hypothetical protein